MDRTFNVKVAGCSFKNDDGSARQKIIRDRARIGLPIILKPEPANRHDPNAIGVWIRTTWLVFFVKEFQLGYLDARLAGEVTRLLKKGGQASARIADIVGGQAGSETLGIVIEMTKSDA